MKKRLGAMLLLLALCLGLAAPALGAEGFADEYSRLYDQADVLSDQEEADLLARLDAYSARLRFDLVIITMEDLGGASPREYADGLYDQCRYGYGSDRDGALLLFSTRERDWYISTRGYGITALTDYGIAYIGEQMKPDLAENEYAAACEVFLGLCEDFVNRAREGQPFDRDSQPRGPLSALWILASLGLGLLIALLAVGVMKSKLKSVRSQAGAGSYVRAGSLNLAVSQDLFLYRTVDRRERPKENSSGGSSTHTASSGEVHGGGGGKY